jgi:hypothetical protein
MRKRLDSRPNLAGRPDAMMGLIDRRMKRE